MCLCIYGQSRGITKAGVGCETINAEVCTKEEIASVVSSCSGFVIGSPTLGGHIPTPVQVTPLLILHSASYLQTLVYKVFWSN